MVDAGDNRRNKHNAMGLAGLTRPTNRKTNTCSISCWSGTVRQTRGTDSLPCATSTGRANGWLLRDPDAAISGQSPQNPANIGFPCAGTPPKVCLTSMVIPHPWPRPTTQNNGAFSIHIFFQHEKYKWVGVHVVYGERMDIEQFIEEFQEEAKGTDWVRTFGHGTLRTLSKRECPITFMARRWSGMSFKVSGAQAAGPDVLGLSEEDTRIIMAAADDSPHRLEDMDISPHECDVIRRQLEIAIRKR